MARSNDHVATKLAIQKITPDGERSRNFKVSDAGPGIDAMDFYVTGTGKVYEEAWDRLGRIHVLEYLADGTLQSNVILDTEPPVFPYQIAVFESGEWLVSGLHGRDLFTPFTAVFDSEGKLIKKIYETEDEDSRKKSRGWEMELSSRTRKVQATIRCNEGDAVTSVRTEMCTFLGSDFAPP